MTASLGSLSDDHPLSEEPFPNIQSEQEDTLSAALENLGRYTSITVTNYIALRKDSLRMILPSNCPRQIEITLC